MNARCDQCKKQFVPEIERRMLNDEIQEIFFKCPECGKEYHVAITDSQIRKLNKEMQTVKEQLLKDKANKKLFSQMQKLMKKHKALMDKLNKKKAV